MMVEVWSAVVGEFVMVLFDSEWQLRFDNLRFFVFYFFEIN